MPVFSYTQISDYVLEQLMSSLLVNTLVDSYRYIGEDILGISNGATSGYAKSIGMNNGATHGGMILFHNGDENANEQTRFLKCDAAGTYLEMQGMDLGITGTNVIQGDRVTLNYYLDGVSADSYMSNQDGANSSGYYATRAGSILSISAFVWNVTSPHPTLQIEVHKNGSNVLASSSMAFSGINTALKTKTTQARGTDTFAVGDYIDAFVNFTASPGLVYAGACIELILDS